MNWNIFKQTRKNLIWNWLLLFFDMAVNFFVRGIIVNSLGIEYAGLGGLFSSILSFLNLAELGIASSVMYFLYKPVAENDTEQIRRLLGLLRQYYRRIGFFVLGAGLAVMPFLRLLIAGNVPDDVNLYEIYLLNLSCSVISYWIFAEKTTLLGAYQRRDITSRISIIVHIIQFSIQIPVLIIFRSYLLFLMVPLVSIVLQRLMIAWRIRRSYPLCSRVMKPDSAMKPQIWQKVRGIILHKIGGLVVNSADSLVISAFLGLRMLGMYQNYYLIFYKVLIFVKIFSSAPQAGIGNIAATSDRDTLYKLFEHFTFFMFCVGTICSCCFLCLYQPFISLWLGDENLLDNWIVLLLCACFYFLQLMAPGNLFETVCGIWNKDKWRPMLEGLLNLCMNVVLVHFIGLYGILLSTIMSMAIFSMPWLYRNVMRFIFPGKSLLRYFLRLLHNLIAAVLICGAMYAICLLMPAPGSAFIALLTRAAVCVTGSVSLLFLFYHKTDSGKWVLSFLPFKPFKKSRAENE